MSECPSASALERFSVGNIDSEAFDEIATHLDECAACDSRLAELESESDRLVSALADLEKSGSIQSAETTDYEQLNARIAMSISAQGQGDVTMDAGRQMSHRLHRGECCIGRFELLEELGVGAFGHVFRARDTRLDRMVALKVQRGYVGKEETLQFEREARNASALKHPHIVTLHETGQTDEGVCYLVSEFIAGETLQRRLSRGAMPPREAALMLAKLADAVHFAHEAGVVHRDIKPANIIVDENDDAHITDFGLAKRRESLDAVTSDGRIMGTPAYMSPEQARGDAAGTDHRTDVYSLGVVLYELLTGQQAFQGSRQMLLLQVLEDEPRPPRRLDPLIPVDLETICLKTMSKTPANRYRTAKDLAEDLRAYLGGNPIKARPCSMIERVWKWCHRYPLAAAIFLGVTLGSGMGFLYLRHLSTWFVQQTALDTARQYADALEEFNGTYSDARADFFGHGEDKGAVPPALPATLQIEVAKRISLRGSGMQVRIFSPHSFRSELRPSNQFEDDTIEAMHESLNQGRIESSQLERYQFVTRDGRDYLQFARGQLMKASCIDCHNRHAASPKQNWKEGDLAGVIMLTSPLDREINRTKAGFRGATLLMLAVAALMTIIGLVLTQKKALASARPISGGS